MSTFPKRGIQVNETPCVYMLSKESNNLIVIGLDFWSGILIFLKVFQYKISTELPWSTSTLVMANLSISIMMTMGSS